MRAKCHPRSPLKTFFCEKQSDHHSEHFSEHNITNNLRKKQNEAEWKIGRKRRRSTADIKKRKNLFGTCIQINKSFYVLFVELVKQRKSKLKPCVTLMCYTHSKNIFGTKIANVQLSTKSENFLYRIEPLAR